MFRKPPDEYGVLHKLLRLKQNLIVPMIRSRTGCVIPSETFCVFRCVIHSHNNKTDSVLKTQSVFGNRSRGCQPRRASASPLNPPFPQPPKRA